ncbi:MAG: DUF6807 domain-containing protein [Planctomycetota bacterium]|jgi:hypothetical protein
MKKTTSQTLVFMLAGLFVVLGLHSLLLAENSALRITVDQDMLSVQAGKRLLLRYRYEESASKPYVRQLFSPAGVNMLRDAPADHLHHHGLMFAVKVDGVNFWEERQACGRQVHKSFTDVRVDKHEARPRASFTEHVDWISPGAQGLLLPEVRTVEITQLKNPGVTVLTWQSIFKPPLGKESATLTGSHYHGLGMRFLKSMDEAGRFRNADGKTGEVFRGDERLLRSIWCAYTADANGKPLTVAMFDHPDNPRHPPTWFTMAKPFAYLSATLNLHTEPLKIEPQKPLMLRYAVAVWDGGVKAGEINRLYWRWTTWPAPATGRSCENK